jgi:hypothetical protein
MKKTLLLAAFSLIAMQTAAHAAWMSGTVERVEGDTVVIQRANSELQEAYPKEINVKILNNAKLKNISSLEELKKGQEVKLDARANKEQGQWDANYIELIDSDSKVPNQP